MRGSLQSNSKRFILKMPRRFGSVLAQSMCGMSGAEECQVGLIVNNIGFKLMCREARPRDEEARLIYDYDIYPPPQPSTGISLYQRCCGTDGIARTGLRRLVRIALELAKTATDRALLRFPIPIITCESMSLQVRPGEMSMTASCCSQLSAPEDLLMRIGTEPIVTK